MRKYEVTLEFSSTETLIVEANNEEEAKDLAFKKAVLVNLVWNATNLKVIEDDQADLYDNDPFDGEY